MLFYVRSGEVDQEINSKTERDAVKEVILESKNKWLGESIFVGKEPITDSYNNEIMFSTDQILQEMVDEHSVQSFECKSHRFTVIG